VSPVYCSDVLTLHRDPDWIAANRMIAASAVIKRAELHTYPHSYLAIVGDAPGIGLAVLPQLLRAVETLAPHGWELVTINRFSDHQPVAVVRRRPDGTVG
jgi:hypothetical protein